MRLQIGRYLDYLGHIFPVDPESGAYRVSATSDLGKLLIAYARDSDRPVPEPEPSRGERVVTLSLPLSSATQNLQNKWLYYSAADEERLISVLKATFNMDLIGYYLKGQVMGYRKKEIIEMFIVSRELMTIDPYDAVHKRVYRIEQRKMRELTRQLLRKTYYFDESLDMTGLI